MSFIPDDILADMRREIQDAMPSTATIARTSISVACRVDSERREERLEGLPTFIRLTRFAISMPDGTDVVGGDAISVLGKGDYYALDTEEPKDYSIATVARCIRTRDASGNLSFPTNVTVTFTNPSDVAHAVEAEAIVYEASADLQIYPAAARYKLAVVYDPTLKDGAGKLVSAGWEVTWTQPNGIERTENLSKPRYLYGALPLAVAYFVENN